MPCFHPLQASFTVRKDGKKDIAFSTANAKQFHFGRSLLFPECSLSIPCGRCIGCRLERSRQWAVRCMHEASLYEDNSFITLTFSPEHLPADGSLSRKHMQDFLKRLRQRFSDRRIRVFYCGEYGEKLGRPHYHAILFNCEFSDKVYWSTHNANDYFTSSILSQLWPFGFSTIGDVTFESAAYVARYALKKVNGDMAESHYAGRLPEFCQASLKPGIGTDWFKKFGMSDIFPRDECVVNGVISKPPRFYDRLLERKNSDVFSVVKTSRDEKRFCSVDDNTFSRLVAKEKCLSSRMHVLIRSMEKVYD